MQRRRRKLLEVSDLNSCYGRITALRGVRLEVNEGELVALVGANGAGKTTLLRTLSGVLTASGGSIRFDGVDITRLPAPQRVRLGIVQVPEGRQVFGPMCVEDNLRLGAYARGGGDRHKSLQQVYEMFPVLRDRRDQPAGTLSGGEQQMLAIGRALMAQPRLLLLDEPSMGLAPILVDKIFEVITALKTASTTILLVEQNANAALAIADRGYVLEAGEITLTGSAAELRSTRRIQEAYLGVEIESVAG
jgi:branched-chain amino acid transport system ATP-binding protein